MVARPTRRKVAFKLNHYRESKLSISQEQIESKNRSASLSCRLLRCLGLQQSSNQLQDVLGASRFHQDAVEAGFLRSLLHFVLGPSGYGDQRDIFSRSQCANLCAGIEAIESRHADVEQHGVRVKALDHFNAAPAIRRSLDLVAPFAQQQGIHFAGARTIVNDQ